MGTFAVRRVHIPVSHDRTTDRRGERPVVLLVTGDPNLREVATRVLEREHYDVVAVAHSGHALLACLAGRRVDVLATELSMEDTSGPALAERLRRHHPGLQAVYFGQLGTRECDNVLVRPFTRDDLLTRVVAASSVVA